MVGDARTPQDLAGLPLVDANEGPGQSVWRLSAGDLSHYSVEFDARLAAGDLKTLLAAPWRGWGPPSCRRSNAGRLSKRGD
ncbi:MAG: hypothetical protein JWQ55_3449 [Rhodopila sp.]|nr:hypothetical protein [Rhodopila sp.]